MKLPPRVPSFVSFTRPRQPRLPLGGSVRLPSQQGTAERLWSALNRRRVPAERVLGFSLLKIIKIKKIIKGFNLGDTLILEPHSRHWSSQPLPFPSPGENCTFFLGWGGVGWGGVGWGGGKRGKGRGMTVSSLPLTSTGLYGTSKYLGSSPLRLLRPHNPYTQGTWKVSH